VHGIGCIRESDLDVGSQIRQNPVELRKQPSHQIKLALFLL